MRKDIEENGSNCKVREGVTSPVKLGGRSISTAYIKGELIAVDYIFPSEHKD